MQLCIRKLRENIPFVKILSNIFLLWYLCYLCLCCCLAVCLDIVVTLLTSEVRTTSCSEAFMSLLRLKSLTETSHYAPQRWRGCKCALRQHFSCHSPFSHISSAIFLTSYSVQGCGVAGVKIPADTGWEKVYTLSRLSVCHEANIETDSYSLCYLVLL